MSNIKSLFDKYIKRVSPLKSEKNLDAIYDSLLNGKNSYLRLTRKGSTSFDSSWITVIEDCLYDLGEIINNPREVTKVDSNVVPIELAKKVDGESVQHLASHTQYIKEVNEAGEVIPSKILSHSHIDDIYTYENRFIATFVRRLVLFVEKRYEFIKENVNLNTEETLMMKNKSIVNGQEVEIETKVIIKKQENDKEAVDTKDYIERIALMREYLTYYYNSSFMKAMKNERNVRKPILQTNIIRKNPLYHKCYETFLFIEKFDSLGVSYHLNENYQSFNEEERKEFNYLLLSDYLAVRDETEFQSIKKTSKTYKPKILTSIDDEKFTYGDIVKGPIEFVRIDDQYRQYLNSKVKEDLPAHPNKYTREYYEEEYDYRRERKLDEKELDKLIARKQKEIALYEKIVEDLIAQRDREEAEAKRRELEAIRAYEEGLIELKRRKIIEAAEAENYGPIDEPKAEEAKEEAKEKPQEKEKTIEDIQKESKKPVEIYRVADGESEINLVDGHIEETFIALDPEFVEELPLDEVLTTKETPEEPNKEEPSVEETQEEVAEEVKDEEPVILDEVVVEDVEEPLEQEENVEEVAPEEPQEEMVEDIPEEKVEEPLQNEEEEPKEAGPVVYHVIGDTEIRYVDGHKEEVMVIDENDDSSDLNEEVECFIVETEDGYYVSENEYSKYETEAKIFTDLDEASEIIDRLGGKVYKL